MKLKGALLGETAPTKTEITLELQGGRTAIFIYSDPRMAREHYLELTALGVCGGYAIKNHQIRAVNDTKKK